MKQQQLVLHRQGVIMLTKLFVNLFRVLQWQLLDKQSPRVNLLQRQLLQMVTVSHVVRHWGGHPLLLLRGRRHHRHWRQNGRSGPL